MTAEKENFCARIGHRFHNEELLTQALSHRSYAAENNERLEFLGDSLLNLLIAEALYRRFPALKEGELSRLRANLVNGVTLADIATEMNFGEVLLLGDGERQSGGRQRRSILANSVEAVIGAISLDSDFFTCKARVTDWYRDR